MKKQTKKLRDKILSKQTLLNQANQQLKKEFIGLDSVIDEVISSISSWFLFPDLQDKPVIVNLWGLTGTGKSSLVNRLVQLLQQERKYFRFDLGENNGWQLKNQLEEIYENENGFPIVLAFDEFQHVRTIGELGEEITDTSRDNRIVWELLDSGKFQITKYDHSVNDLYDFINKLNFFLREGVQVKNGLVISRKEFFVEEMGLEKKYINPNSKTEKLDLKKVNFVKSQVPYLLFDLTRDRYKTPFEIKETLMKLNGEETIAYLTELFEFATSPKTVDCSKAIIFVLGNLDEAYTMSKNYNPDVNADEFHEMSLKINVPIIKKALQERFRNEQIARLGNNHIIYPAFSSKSFYKIIDLELKKIANKVYKSQDILLDFDESIKELIYKEGVYPTQGTRPIFTTIYQVVNSKLAKIVAEKIINKVKGNKVKITYNDGFVSIDYFLKKKVVFHFKEKQILKLENLRKNKKDDIQAITAVHESGHAICSVFLMKTIPEVIYSITAEANSHGFVFTKYLWNYISKKEIINRLSMLLGGYAAERIVFGEENVTAGSESDIEKATELISDMIKNCGMGKLPAKYQVKDLKTNLAIHDTENHLKNDIEEWIKSAYSLTEKILKEQESLLLHMADFLSDNRMMNKESIEKYCKIYGVNYSSELIIRNGDNIFYRNHLKQKIKTVSTKQENPVVDSYGFSLNKDVNSKID